jgi:hypothetical protein
VKYSCIGIWELIEKLLLIDRPGSDDPGNYEKQRFVELNNVDLAELYSQTAGITGGNNNTWGRNSKTQGQSC